ncbi:MAG: ABC transporter substrate-binding protein [Proteobacteria bacterium]|nr:ABC transporter substrate-binding protein [Pseudomonadota bacterium]
MIDRNAVRRLMLATALTALWLGSAGSPASAQSGALATSGLVGKLEGAELVLDAAKMPTAFKEAPQLAKLVAEGKLPPVKERVGQEPLVIKPLQEIGKYGGIWRRGFIGAFDGENGNRINASDKLLFWDSTGTKIVPSVAKSWEMSPDGRKVTVKLRRGMKWSDGAPFNADDFVFWFEDLYSNKELVPTPIADMQVNGKPGRVVKIDETTVAFQFDDPNFLFIDMLAGDTLIGGGQSVRQSQTYTYGAYAPAHYLKKFLPKYSSEAQVTQMAKAEGYDTWVKMMHFKKDWQLNPELPTIGPWHMTKPINTPTWVMERNPFYWAVDTEGNQLPYIDQIIMTLGENLEVLNLRAIAGEFDLQERHIDLGKLPVLLENQKKGNYALHLDLAFNGADTTMHFNHSYKADPEIAKWIGTADFRRALSLGIDRDQMNETFWLGVGVPGSVVPADASPYNPGPEWRKKWSTYDPAKANQMLDAIGLAKKDSEGFRVRTDNGQRLRIEIQTVKAFMPWPQQMEMVAQQWRKIGIQADVKEYERLASLTRVINNEHHIMVWTNGGTELLYLFPRHAIPVDPTEAYMGPEFAKWFTSGGTQGIEPKDPSFKQIFKLFQAAAGQQEQERYKTAQEIWKIIVDQQISIGTVGQSPALMGVRVASNKLGNIPSRACIAQHCRTPGSSHPETWFYK